MLEEGEIELTLQPGAMFNGQGAAVARPQRQALVADGF